MSEEAAAPVSSGASASELCSSVGKAVGPKLSTKASGLTAQRRQLTQNSAGHLASELLGRSGFAHPPLVKAVRKKAVSPYSSMAERPTLLLLFHALQLFQHLFSLRDPRFSYSSISFLFLVEFIAEHKIATPLYCCQLFRYIQLFINFKRALYFELLQFY